jgi:hypothetical protein
MTNQTPQNKPDFKTGQENPQQNKPRTEHEPQQAKKDVHNDRQNEEQKTGTNR